MTVPSGSLVVTGASGFVGARLVRAARERGWNVEAWARRLPPASGDGIVWREWAFGEPPPRLPGDCAAVIHCAYEMGGAADLGLFERNVSAALRVREAALAQPRARFLFLSSQSAHRGALSAYGRSKQAIEDRMDSPRDFALKSGFVVGPGGIYARLRESLKRLPVTPLFYGGRQPIHPIWVGDLAALLLHAAENGTAGVAAAGRPALPLREFYRLILEAEGLRRPMLPLPGEPFLPLFRLAERYGLRLPVNSENLLGLKALVSFDAEIARSPLPAAVVPVDEAIARALKAE